MTRKLIALLLAVAMIACCAAAAAEAPYGPTYDEWSEMTDEELYEKAKAEGGGKIRRAVSGHQPGDL